ncbi:WASH complex, subunit strumpellin [Ostreococcus tauri]|uniref:WASH complex, subunit strumpellin n=1 Tax=Ostreococcus tauri TaxID=70448 RepID=A0A090M200_OSTTA|nr:WASH complex, subunit strumpellin [Ostreococcus tauri]CEF98260.1 WASH complex, subunit strumpellin [Ostreococcus tauri]|eukprot:XP_022839168.1 WASH complex, subunit strumpellin [Ostreococcus tauri]
MRGADDDSDDASTSSSDASSASAAGAGADGDDGGDAVGLGGKNRRDDSRWSATRQACAFVARAQALIAEVSRLARSVPRGLRGAGDARHASVLFDYDYFENRDALDARVDDDARLSELDDEVEAVYGTVLTRYWCAFDAVVRWHQDFTRFAEDVRDGTYVRDTWEKILADEDGRQYVAEAIALYGVILKILDEKMDWRFRERAVVAYYRHKGRMIEDEANANEIVALCARTGFDASRPGSRPTGYPETYFARCEFPEWLITMVIGRLRTDDVYNHAPHYPNPDHRSTALAAQGGLLYVILYWAPSILVRGTSAMREIVDRHYADNWVVTCVPGMTVNLLAEWQPYEAAATAMRNAVTPRAAKELIENASTSVDDLKMAFNTYLTEGVLTEEFVLENERVLMNVVRDANVVARFLLLQNSTPHASVSLAQMPSKEKIVDLLLDCAELENALKTIYTSLLSTKNELWEECKREAGDRMRELSAYFGGTAGLSRNKKDDNLRLWFANLSVEVDRLSYDDPVAAGRTIQELDAALTEVEHFHQIIDNIHAKQYLLDSRRYLGKMMMTTNVADSALNTLTIVSDGAYAWGLIDSYTEQLQQRVRRDPFAVQKLRFLFIKLKSILEMPLLRISQIESPDIYSVSEYYSSQLVSYVRNVIEVVPVSMFEILNEIVGVQTDALKELPTKLAKAELKNYAQLVERSKLSKATYEIAIFAQGILAMDSTFMGVIELNPKKLLEDGIRKQLVKQITETFHTTLVFGEGVDGLGWNNFVAAMMKSNPFQDRLNLLAKKLEGFRRSFEYIQDYVNIYGLQMWQEETNRVVSYHVEQECNGFLKRKHVAEGESEFQSVAIPIPDHPPLDAESKTFMGRLLREILRQTDPTTTRYIAPHSAWFSVEGKEIVGIQTFSLLTSAVGNVGLNGLDRILSFMVKQRLQLCLETCGDQLAGELGSIVRAMNGALQPIGSVPSGALAAYDEMIKASVSSWDDFIAALSFIGQAQVLRMQLNAELVANVRIDSHTLSRVLDTANRAILTDVRAHYKSPDEAPYPDESNVVIPKLSAYLAASGMQNPSRQIYCAVGAVEDFGAFIFAFTAAQLELYRFDAPLASLVPVTARVDAYVLIVGVSTALRQHHADQTTSYLSHMGAYVRARLASPSSADVFTPGVRAAVAWSKRFAVVHDIPLAVLAGFFPPFVLDHACASPIA